MPYDTHVHTLGELGLVEYELTLAWSTVAVIPVLTTDIALCKVLFILKQSPHPLGRIFVEYTRP